MVQYISPRLKISKNKNWTYILAQENKEKYKKLVCYSDPRKEVDQENNMDSRVDQVINIWSNKVGTV